jgi:peptidoglycan/xylan/chitin deacetylase (PgdA/CDA1 family)
MPAARGTRENRRLAVSLTFDFDADSAFLRDGLAASSPNASRWLYGPNEGVRRILKVLDKYKVPATFFIPGATCDHHSEVAKTIIAAGHEVGHHGYYHEAPSQIDEKQERMMIERGLDAIERLTGRLPRGYRSPSWELSEVTLSLLAEYGIVYDASQLAMDRPHWVHDGGRKTMIVEVPSAWELCDAPHFLFAYYPTYLAGMSAPSKVEEIWRGDFDGLYAEGGDACYVLTMHPEIMGRPHRIQLLERIIEYILGHEGVWCTHMQEIANDFITAQRHNPPSF